MQNTNSHFCTVITCYAEYWEREIIRIREGKRERVRRREGKREIIRERKRERERIRERKRIREGKRIRMKRLTGMSDVAVRLGVLNLAVTPDIL